MEFAFGFASVQEEARSYAHQLQKAGLADERDS
jgi:hypothetical protein